MCISPRAYGLHTKTATHFILACINSGTWFLAGDCIAASVLGYSKCYQKISLLA